MKSYIGYTPQDNTSYAVQYQETFEFLFNNREKAKVECKLIDLPMLYLLTHYLELSFKYNIEYFKDFSNCEDGLGKLNETHDLEKLFTAFKSHFDKSINKVTIPHTLKTQIKTYFKELKKLIDKLKEIDEFSISFRYAYARNGQRTIPLEETLDLIEDIGKPYKGSKDLLDYSIYVHKDYLGDS